MRIRLAVLIAAGVGACAMIGASSPAQAWCHNNYGWGGYGNYSPCGAGAQYGYSAGYSYGYQYAQPYYQQQTYYQPQTYYRPPVYQQPVYQQPVYQQPVYQQPYYPQPAYPQQSYAPSCCEPNWWEKLWGARNCCAPANAQANYPAVETNVNWSSDSSWSWPWSSKDVQINNNGNVYVMRDGVSVNGLRPGYAAVEPGAVEAETYVQPAPRYYRKRVYRTRYSGRPRVVVRTVYKTRVVYVRPKPRPHVLVPGNPSSSAGTYDVAPKKVLRP